MTTEEYRVTRMLFIGAFLMFASGGYVLGYIASIFAPWYVYIPVALAPCTWFGISLMNKLGRKDVAIYS